MSLKKLIRAFTLIELLIVVAIIAILAAIAIPNFLEAQVRSKVSRAKNDMRTLATAMEAYFVDTNQYPSDNVPRPTKGDTSVNLCIGNELSTPIAYISSVDSLADPFRLERADLRASTALKGRFRYGYTNWFIRYKNGTTTALWIMSTYGNWRLYSAGPDKYVFNSVEGGYSDYSSYSGGVNPNYDATNGSISVGDIFRTAAFGGEPINEKCIWTACP